jgi:hypothetical protein
VVWAGWALSDGFTTSEPSFTRTFTDPGIYKATLTVQAASGLTCTEGVTRSGREHRRRELGCVVVGVRGRGAEPSP